MAARCQCVDLRQLRQAARNRRATIPRHTDSICDCPTERIALTARGVECEASTSAALLTKSRKASGARSNACSPRTQSKAVKSRGNRGTLQNRSSVRRQPLWVCRADRLKNGGRMRGNERIATAQKVSRVLCRRGNGYVRPQLRISRAERVRRNGMWPDSTATRFRCARSVAIRTMIEGLSIRLRETDCIAAFSVSTPFRLSSFGSPTDNFSSIASPESRKHAERQNIRRQSAAQVRHI